MNLSSAGLELTKQFEGCKLTAYQDQGGVWTIGYGHTGPGVVEGMTITQDQADAYLAQDMAWAVQCVIEYVTLPIAQNQFDALVDFVFNVGCTAFHESTLLVKVNAGLFHSAAAQFNRWVYVKGQISAGLVRRREAEQAMFLGE